MKRQKLFAVALLGAIAMTSCDKLEELDREIEARNLKNLQEWVVNATTSEKAIATFGYENCFKTVAMDDATWGEFNANYQGDKSVVSRSDYACVRSLFYCQSAMTHIHIGEIICNKSIAPDLQTIFRKLYEEKYNIESLMPVMTTNLDELTQNSSPSNNYTFSFHFLSNPVDELHLKGLAVVVNPYTPPTADDLAVRLFKQHGFTWGGDVAGGKRYRFEKK